MKKNIDNYSAEKQAKIREQREKIDDAKNKLGI